MRDELQVQVNQKDDLIQELEFELRESKARESVDTAIEFYRKEKEKICHKNNLEKEEAIRDYWTIHKDWERTTKELAFASKTKNEALKRT